MLRSAWCRYGPAPAAPTVRGRASTFTQRVLDQILGVLTSAGHATGGAAEGVDVDRKRLGEEFLGHATRLPFRRRSPYGGTHP